MRRGLCGFALTVLTTVGYGQTVAQPRLMDAPAARSCAVQDEWATPAEKNCYATTPDYPETMAYLRRVQAAAPKEVKIEPFGRSGEGRELDIVIVSHDGIFDPAELHG